jgi:hypothetical protein
MGFMNLADAQKILVTDDALFSTPSTLLHIHKTGTSGDMLQLTNGSSTGTGSSYGFKIDLPTDKSVNINNQENAAMKFWTNNTLHMTLDASGNVTITGQLYYAFIHGACYAENISYTVPVTQNVYSQINPSPAMTVSEADGLTLANNTITILTAGDYKVDIILTLNGATSEDFRVKMYKGASAYGPGSNRISTSGATNYVSLSYFWYVSFVANDVISFYITNTSSDNDPTISDMKVYLEKKPE